MSKKFIIGVLSFLLLAGGVGAGVYLVQRNQSLQEQAAPASSIKLVPEKKTVFVGESQDVTVHIDTGTNKVGAVSLDIKYPQDMLRLDSFEAGTALKVVLTPATIDNNTGTATLTLGAQPTNEYQGKDGLVATLKFAALAQGSPNITFGANTSARGIEEASGTNILISKTPTNFKVISQADSTPTPQSTTIPSTPATPTVSATPNPTPTPASGGTTQTTPTPAGSATPAASTKPTVTLPSSGKVVAGSTISGTAAPNSIVTIVIKSQTITATVKADSTGKWSYKIPSDLENGTHTITVTDSNGTVTKSFVVTGSTATSSAATSSADIPQTGNGLPTMVAAFAGIILLVVGLAIAL